MSTQSIFVKSIDSIQEASEETLLKNANKYILEKRFALGKGMKSEETKHAARLLDFLCTENCELIDYLNKSLIGDIAEGGGCSTHYEDNSCIPYVNNTNYLHKCATEDLLNNAEFLESIAEKLSEIEGNEPNYLGWVLIQDTQYNSVNTFEIQGGINTKLTNNSGVFLDVTQPVGGLLWWNTSTSKFIPDNIGDSYEFTIEFSAKPRLNDQNLKIEVNIGGTTGVYFSKTIKLLKGAGEVNKISETVDALITDDFVLNGGEIFLESDTNIDIYDIVFKIERTLRNT